MMDASEREYLANVTSRQLRDDWFLFLAELQAEEAELEAAGWFARADALATGGRLPGERVDCLAKVFDPRDRRHLRLVVDNSDEAVS